MLEKLQKKNIIAAILYLILLISNLSGLLNHFQLSLFVVVIAEILLCCALYKNNRGKLVIMALFLQSVVSAAGFMSFVFYSFNGTFNLFRWIPPLVSMAGTFMVMIIAVISFTDLLPSYKEHLPKLKYMPVLLMVVGALWNLVLGTNVFANFFMWVVSCCAVFMLSSWMVSPEDQRMEEGMAKMTESIQAGWKKTVDAAKQKVEEMPKAAAEPKAVAEPKANNDDSVEVLKKFKTLLDEGLITQEEYDAKKKEVLGL